MVDHVNIQTVLESTDKNGPIWSVSSTQLNANLLRLSTGEGIPLHVNTEVDVVFVIFEGRGQLTVNDEVHELAQGKIFFVPQGTARMLRCTGGPLVYLTCHRRRAGLMPRSG